MTTTSTIVHIFLVKTYVRLIHFSIASLSHIGTQCWLSQLHLSHLRDVLFSVLCANVTGVRSFTFAPFKLKTWDICLFLLISIWCWCDCCYFLFFSIWIMEHETLTLLQTIKMFIQTFSFVNESRRCIGLSSNDKYNFPFQTSEFVMFWNRKFNFCFYFVQWHLSQCK